MSSQPRILVANELEAVTTERGLAPVVDRVSKHFRLTKLSEVEKMTEEERGEIRAMLMIWFNVPQVTPQLLDLLPNLGYVQTCTKGVNHIDLALCKARGVRVGNLPDVYSVAVAEHAISLMLASTRHIIRADVLTRSKNAQSVEKFEIGAHKNTEELLGTIVNKKTMGIVGFGAIGLHIAQLGVGLKMRVVYNDIAERKDLAAHGLPHLEYFAKLTDLLAQADVVILAVPSIPQTRGMINREMLKAMKKGVVLVNIARGDVVDTMALVEELKSGHVQACGLDVTDPEPLPAGHPLLDLKNVTLTPHMAYYSDTGMLECASIADKAMHDFHAGVSKLDNEVDLDLGF